MARIQARNENENFEKESLLSSDEVGTNQKTSFFRSLLDFRGRLLMTGLLLLVNILNYVTRANIGQILVTDHFLTGYTTPERSYIQAGFYYGYIATQLLGGYFAGIIGPKSVLLMAVCVWGVSDFCGLWVSDSLPLFFTARVILGLGEGLTYPCMHLMQSAWIPVYQRNILMSIIMSGQDLGTILSMLLAPLIINRFGWHYVFIFTFVFAVSWFLSFFALGSSSPESSKIISHTERELILSTRQIRKMEMPTKIPFGIFKRKELWAIVIAHFCINYGWYVLLGWLPLYYKNVLKVNPKELYYTCVPYLFGLLGSYVGGIFSNLRVVRSRWKLVVVRKFCNSVGTFIPGIMLCILSSGIVQSPVLATAILSFSMFTTRVGTIGYWVNMIDIAPNAPQIVMGISNTFATLPGIFGNTITGWLLNANVSKGDEAHWGLVFGIGAFFYFLGGICFLFMAGVDPILTDMQSEYNAIDDLADESETNMESERERKRD